MEEGVVWTIDSALLASIALTSFLVQDSSLDISSIVLLVIIMILCSVQQIDLKLFILLCERCTDLHSNKTKRVRIPKMFFLSFFGGGAISSVLS